LTFKGTPLVVLVRVQYVHMRTDETLLSSVR